jgi:drug/metabolite transporter (DMT)-like permease
MACFTAPAAVAIVTTLFRKRIPAKYHINWLNTLLWGGTAGLALEHVAHEEIVPYFPYLTAMKSAADTATMVSEILSIGVMMLVVCVVVWAVMVYVASRFEAGAKTAAVQAA